MFAVKVYYSLTFSCFVPNIKNDAFVRLNKVLIRDMKLGQFVSCCWLVSSVVHILPFADLNFGRHVCRNVEELLVMVRDHRACGQVVVAESRANLVVNVESVAAVRVGRVGVCVWACEAR